jgi:hypothetical protein
MLARRLGRNSAWNHAGNLAIALVAGGVGYLSSQRVVFLLVPVFAALTSAAVLTIPASAINHDRARDLGHDGADDGAAAGWGVLFRTRPLAIFASSGAFLPICQRAAAAAGRIEARAAVSERSNGHDGVLHGGGAGRDVADRRFRRP